MKTWVSFKYFVNDRRKSVSNKLLRDKTFNIVKNQKYNEYQHKTSVLGFFGKFFSACALARGNKSDIKSEIMFYP